MGREEVGGTSGSAEASAPGWSHLRKSCLPGAFSAGLEVQERCKRAKEARRGRRRLQPTVFSRRTARLTTSTEGHLWRARISGAHASSFSNCTSKHTSARSLAGSLPCPALLSSRTPKRPRSTHLTRVSGSTEVDYESFLRGRASTSWPGALVRPASRGWLLRRKAGGGSC